MDTRELAVSQFHLIEKSLRRRNEAGSEAQAWLEKYAVPAITAYWKRPRFRDNARWSIQNLAEGAPSEDRQILDDLQKSAEAASRLIQELARRPDVSKQIKVLVSPPLPPSGEIVISDETHAENVQPRRSVASFGCAYFDPDSLNRFIQEKAFCYVNIAEYFEPSPKFEEVNGQLIQRAETITSVNPQFMPVGDMIVQAMLRRIDLAQQAMQDVHRTVLTAVSKTDSIHEELTERVNRAMEGFKNLVAGIRPRFVNTQEARLRQSCCVLTQIYAARDRREKCDWLGLPDSLVESGRATVMGKLRSWRGVEIYYLIANALTELGQLYQGQPNDSALDEALANRRLVIDKKTSRLWWDAAECRVDFSAPQFRVLYLLAERASRRQAIREDDIFDNEGSHSRFATMIGRLKKCLPEQLRELIIAGEETSTYRLNISGDQVYVVQT